VITARAVVAVHDVSPATWRECRELFAMLAHASVPVATLLVIPDYHHRAEVAGDRAFCRAVGARLDEGDEAVLHGMFHLDESAPPRTFRGFFERRLLTRREGEFAVLAEGEAAERIARGIALFDALGWPLHGFVPPAWLLGDGARRAISATGERFRYVSVRGGLYRLPEWHFVHTFNLCYSPTSVLRRAWSRAAIAAELRRARDDALLRITLHPQDARHRSVLRHWERVIGDVATTRRFTTKRDFVSSLTPRPATRPLPAHAAARASAPS
jgi:predicted deacetylase